MRFILVVVIIFGIGALGACQTTDPDVKKAATEAAAVGKTLNTGSSGFPGLLRYSDETADQCIARIFPNYDFSEQCSKGCSACYTTYSSAASDPPCQNWCEAQGAK